MISRFLPEPDHDQAVEFLKQYAQGQPIHLVAMEPDQRPISKTFDDTEEIARWLMRWHEDANFYFHVNRARPGVRDVKFKKEHVDRVVALHVDIDDARGNVLDRLREYEPHPSIIINSGGGFHAYWLLRDATDEVLRAEQCNVHLANQLGGDNCHNVDRIMRLPGTINFPNRKKIAAGRKAVLAEIVEAEWTRRYSLDDFTAAAPTPAGPKGAIAQAALVVPVDLQDLPNTVTAEVRELIELGDDAERPIRSEGARFPSRSEAVFSVCCALAKAGCPDEVIAGILINPALRISDSVLEKPKPADYARKQAKSARDAVENGWPDRDRGGRPLPTMRNAYVALLRLGLNCSYDLFRHRKIIQGYALESHQGEVSDHAITVLRSAIIDHFGFDPRSDHVRDAVSALCLERTVHPIREMLDILTWDGVSRLDRWLSTYLGVAETDYASAVSAIMLVAAVRRVRKPGVKFDQIIVLEGAQGSGKSTALQILAGPGNHSDQDILTAEVRQQMELMEGVWIYELGEIQGLNRAEISKTKAFASRTVDQSRMAYGYFKVSRPRQLIFVGTTNEDTYLRDQTGNRRFWPLRTGTIDLEALRRDRDQLWAEAASREAEGMSITLPEKLWAAAAAEQAERLKEDPWLETLAAVRGKAEVDVVRVATADLLEKLDIPMERRTAINQKRLASIMSSLGWTKAKFRVAGQTLRGYQRPKPPDHQDDKQLKGQQ